MTAKVLFIPYYVHQAVEYNKVDMEIFLKACAHVGKKEDVERTLGKFSTKDLKDIVSLNILMLLNTPGMGSYKSVTESNIICSVGGVMEYLKGGYDYIQAEANDVIDMLSTSIDNSNEESIELITGHEHKENDPVDNAEPLFSMTHTNGTILVVVNHGFTDFMKYGKDGFIVDFYKDLIDFMFSAQGDTPVYESAELATYLYLTRKKVAH